jgi:rhodanese-related sulfurtransferase
MQAAICASQRRKEPHVPPKISIGVDKLIADAESEIENLDVNDAIRMHGSDDVVFVDTRDIRELNREGRIPGAFHCPRGMLEFWIDPNSQYHKPVFAQDKRYVLFCAAGARSALATKAVQSMGLKPVAHIRGGFGAWKAAGGPIETPAREA